MKDSGVLAGRSVSFLIAGLALAATFVPALGLLFEDVRELDRNAPGELWRPLTGHLAHGSATHLALNLIVFLPLALWRERRVGSLRLAIELTALALGVAGGVRLLHGDWATYRGLSGVVYGLIAIVFLTPPFSEGGRAAVEQAHGRARGIGRLVVGVLVVKSALEYSGKRLARRRSRTGSIARRALSRGVALCGTRSRMRHRRLLPNAARPASVGGPC